MINMLDNNDYDVIVALYRESPKIQGQHDRIIWCKSEKRFIYGDKEEYMVYHGEEDKPRLDVENSIQEIIKNCYIKGLTQCGSSFYDDGNGRLYEITDTSKPHKLIFDANVVTR